MKYRLIPTANGATVSADIYDYETGIQKILN